MILFYKIHFRIENYLAISGFTLTKPLEKFILFLLFVFTFVLLKLEFGFYKSYIYGLFTPVTMDYLTRPLCLASFQFLITLVNPHK